MPDRSQRSLAPVEWPPALRQLVRAAEVECPEGHAAALRELTVLALSKVPSRGIFDPAVRSEQELFTAIDSVAHTHLELSDARDAWRTALRRANLSLEAQDDIEEAALQVQTSSDTAYFYAGLAFALAFAYGYRVAS
jgi:hypothetical protein